jgi:hypothetical protein
MQVKKLKVGDRVRIIGVPGVGVPNYYIHPGTIRAYKKLIARGRSVRIFEIDEYGSPWYRFRFRRKNGTWEHHWMVIMENDTNWVMVRQQKKAADA